MLKNAIMWFNKKKINELGIEYDELPLENTIYDPEEAEKKNLEILLSLETFYERLLCLAKLFYALGIVFGILFFVFLFICWRLTILCFGIAAWCFWYARSKSNLADCAPSFIRFIMISDDEIRKAQEDPNYKIQLPQAKDFI